jgi:hypothetical protein
MTILFSARKGCDGLKPAPVIRGLVASGAFLVAALLPAYAADVLTYHNDNFRSGLNSSEFILTTQTVASKFGHLFDLAVDGKVDAQPLYVGGVTISGGTHNVLYVATENDSIYAFDADTGTKYLEVSLLKNGDVPSDNHGCSQVTPQIGITATPVIDRSQGPHGTIYLVTMTKDTASAYHQRLHALDLTTFAEEFAGPKEIAAVLHGEGTTGPEHNASGDLTFNPGQYKERSALVLTNGVIYLSFASHCDDPPYTGWMMGYSETTLTQVSVLNVDPKGVPNSTFLTDGSGNSFWNSGAGPAVDAAGNLYSITANGPFDPTLDSNGFPINGDFGDAVIKVSTTGSLTVTDYFTPWNQQTDANDDTDLGSGQIMLIPDLTNAANVVKHLAVAAGKDGHLYVLDRDNMGKFNTATQSNNNYQDISGALSGGEWATAAYFNGRVYYGPVGNNLLAFSFNSNAQLGTSPSSKSSITFAYPGATPSVSSNGSTNGIVWALENVTLAKLHAYDATNLATELYNSTGVTIGAGNKFVTPTISGGKVYVPTQTSVAVFGTTGSPLITFQPQGQQLAGTALTLAVYAAGSGPLSYQWLLNGTAIAGATSSTYTTSNPGNYSVTVSNGQGSVTSNVAALLAPGDIPTLSPAFLVALVVLLALCAHRALRPKPIRPS